jgi:hypothetical protein
MEVSGQLHFFSMMHIAILIHDLEKTEAKNDCADEGQKHFNQPTNQPKSKPVEWSRLVSDLS